MAIRANERNACTTKHGGQDATCKYRDKTWYRYTAGNNDFNMFKSAWVPYTYFIQTPVAPVDTHILARSLSLQVHIPIYSIPEPCPCHFSASISTPSAFSSVLHGFTLCTSRCSSTWEQRATFGQHPSPKIWNNCNWGSLSSQVGMILISKLRVICIRYTHININIRI